MARAIVMVAMAQTGEIDQTLRLEQKANESFLRVESFVLTVHLATVAGFLGGTQTFIFLYKWGAHTKRNDGLETPRDHGGLL